MFDNLNQPEIQRDLDRDVLELGIKRREIFEKYSFVSKE